MHVDGPVQVTATIATGKRPGKKKQFDPSRDESQFVAKRITDKELPYCMAILGDCIEARVLFDSGAKVNIISEDVFNAMKQRKTKFRYEQVRGLVLTDINKKRVLITNVISTEIRLPGVVGAKVLRFHVMSGCAEDMLIGSPDMLVLNLFPVAEKLVQVIHHVNATVQQEDVT